MLWPWPASLDCPSGSGTSTLTSAPSPLQQMQNVLITFHINNSLFAVVRMSASGLLRSFGVSRCRRFLPGFWFGSSGIGVGLTVGRLLAGSVEVWVLFQHLRATLQQDIQPGRGGAR